MKFGSKKYSPVLGLRETAEAVSFIKSSFPSVLSKELRLLKVPAPLFVLAGTGINDDLNGTERPVSFSIKQDPGMKIDVVHSLAKWKRMTLASYEMLPGEGLYTDMSAIRADEGLDRTHSLLVDQWDWERVITPQDRSLDYLKTTVRSIYKSIRHVEHTLYSMFPTLTITLPEDIFFVHAQELADLYPTLTAKEREKEICKKYGAVFVIGIGGDLGEGIPHDGRAPDYDDWSTPTGDGFKGLNGDILLWNPVLEDAFEISSMGIRVDRVALERQLALRGCPERKHLYYHSLLLEDKIPLSIGGGIGQSRLCMFLLKKAHIGEVQASIWPEYIVNDCISSGIGLL
jgi:aspartate--ammonia ligase